jgi:hypothetical protein
MINTLLYKTALSLGLTLLFLLPVIGQDNETEPEFLEENAQCLQCHKKSHYFYYNEEIGDSIKEFMCPNRRIDSSKFYNSVHGSFSCFDCHSPDYTEFPHPGHLRLEPQWSCLDCHGYDEEYAHFHFEEIQEEYDKSVHAQEVEEFSCWSCHDPHSYQLTAREAEDIREVVAYDNSICLDCHGDVDQFQLLTDREGINIIEQHDWLPRQELHFKSVRCIECHTEVHDTILVAHNVKPATEAVERCVDCHSQNSILLGSLYKYQVAERRSKYGFLNGPLIEDYYVIGATRNYYLNVASIVIFVLVLLGIVVHAVLRVQSKKKM